MYLKLVGSFLLSSRGATLGISFTENMSTQKGRGWKQAEFGVGSTSVPEFLQLAHSWKTQNIKLIQQLNTCLHGVEGKLS